MFQNIMEHLADWKPDISLKKWLRQNKKDPRSKTLKIFVGWVHKSPYQQIPHSLILQSIRWDNVPQFKKQRHTHFRWVTFSLLSTSPCGCKVIDRQKWHVMCTSLKKTSQHTEQNNNKPKAIKSENAAAQIPRFWGNVCLTDLYKFLYVYNSLHAVTSLGSTVQTTWTVSGCKSKS